MLTKSLLLAASSLLVAVEGARCNADNCARAAAGSRGIPRDERLASCSSYQTGTATYVVSAAIITASPSTVPAFAAAQCTREGSYASACSCAGVTTSSATILLYPTDTPCGGGPESSRYTAYCGYGPNPETNKGVLQDVNGAGTGSYKNCADACSPRPRCFAFLYNAVTRGCSLYDYATTADEETRTNLQRAEPESIFAVYN